MLLYVALSLECHHTAGTRGPHLEVQFQAKILAERCTQKDTSYGQDTQMVQLGKQKLCLGPALKFDMDS